MGTGQSRLTIKVETEGAKEGAQDLKGVADAQDKVAKTGAESTGKVQQATEAQKKLNASTEDWAALLNRAHPALGAVVDAMAKGARVAGDLGSKSIRLGGALGKTTAAATKHAKALLLIGAGGAVVAAMGMIVHTLGVMRAAYERANQRIKQHSEYLAENTRRQKEATKAYRDDAAARDKRSGDNIANLRKERAYVERLIERHELSGQRAERARATGQAIAGLDLTTAEQKAAILGAAGGRQALAIGPGVPEGTAAARTRAFIGRPGTQQGIGRIEEQAEEERRLRAQAAYRELVAAGGSRANLEEFLVRQGAVTTPEEAKERAEQLQRIGVTNAADLEARKRTPSMTFGWMNPFGWKMFGGEGAGADQAHMYPSEHERTVLGGIAQVGADPLDAAQMRRALEALTNELRMNREGRGTGTGSPGISGGGQPVIVIQNSRVAVPGSAFDQGRVRNGDTYARELEMEANSW